MKYRNSIFLVLLLGLFSCRSIPVYKINLNAINDGQERTHVKYTIIPGDEKINSNDLQFIEFSKYLIKLLSTLGYEYANRIEESTQIILLNYSLSAPIAMNDTISTPIYGQTGWDADTRYSGGTISSRGKTSGGGSSTIYTPQYGVTGYNQTQNQYFVYDRIVTITSIDYDVFKSSKIIKPIWKLHISSQGSKNDLRSIFPRMLFSSRSVLGKDTNGIINILQKENDEEYQFFINGIDKKN